jgi:uncharacterized protein
MSEGVGFAVALGSPALAEAMLDAGHDADGHGLSGSSPLGTASWAGDASMVRVLLAHGADPNLRGWDTPTSPLGEAVWAGNAEVVGLLLAAGADPNLPDCPPTGMLDPRSSVYREMLESAPAVPLHYAAKHGREDIVRLLLAGGANPRARDHRGRTPAALALAEGHSGVAALLVRAEQRDGTAPLSGVPESEARAAASD